MVTKKNKKKSSARWRNKGEEEGARFYKIIHPCTAEEYRTKLRFPPKFARKFGSKVSDFANLVVPNGVAWRVGLSRVGREIWFDQGWKEFVDQYSIGYGSFLVFQFTGCSSFSVVICDTTASEIEYPCGGTNDDEGPSHETAADSQAYRTQPPFSSERSVSMHAPSASNEKAIPPEKDRFLEKNKGKIAEFGVDQSMEGKPTQIFPGKVKTKCKGAVISVDAELCDGFRLKSPGSEKAMREARSYLPQNPSFQVLLRPCDTSLPVLHVPAEFSDRLDAAPEYIKLQAPSGSKRLVQLVWRQEGGVEFGNGWSQFAGQNNLKGGDVCVFELLEAQMEFKVSIFRADEAPVIIID